jgi:SnoaL-like domain
MTLDRNAVSRWLEAYVRAWESYAPEAISALFAEDATYAWHPWDEGDDVARGRDAIVKAWLDDRDAPGTYTAEYAPLAIEGQLAVAAGKSRYFDSNGALVREYYNSFVLRFDDQGRCTSFVEWFMKKPDGT